MLQLLRDCRLPHRRLSAPFLALQLDLQARVDAVAGKSGGGADSPAGNSCGAVASDGRSALLASPACKQLTACGADRRAASWETDETLTITMTESGRWNAVAFWFCLDMGSGSGGDSFGADSRVYLSSWHCEGSCQPASAVGTSWQQSVQYIDPVPVQQVRTSIAMHVKTSNHASGYVTYQHLATSALPDWCTPSAEL